MGLKSAIAAGIGGVVLVIAGAGGAGAAPPTVPTPYPQAGLSNLGACSGIAVGTVRSSQSGYGLTTTAIPETISLKGAPSSPEEAVAGTVGACLLSPKLGVASTVPTVLKFTAKLTSSSFDCKLQTTSDNEQPLFGKVSWSFDTDGDGVENAKMMGYVRFVGLDSTSPDLAWMTGIVTKGQGVGATLGGNVWYMPVAKDKLATGTYSSPNRWGVDAAAGGRDIAYSVAPGFGYSAKNADYYGNCGQFGPISGIPNVQAVALGSLSTSGFGFGHTSSGIVFLR